MKKFANSSTHQRILSWTTRVLAIFGYNLLVGVKKTKEYVPFPFFLILLAFVLSLFSRKQCTWDVFIVACRIYFIELWFNDTTLILYIIIILKIFLKCISYLLQNCCLYIFNMFVITDQSQRGSLFTLFLNNPLMAFLFVSGLSSMRRGLWEKCQEYLRKINRDIAQLLTHSRSIGTLLI